MTARLTPGARRDTGFVIHGFARLAGRVTGTEPPAVFLTIGRHRRLFWGWLAFAGVLMLRGRLSRREKEIVILRVGARTGSDYELTQHRRLGKRVGLSDTEIARVESGELEGWSEADRLLLDVTDELLADGDLSDETWRRLRAARGERGALELLMLIGHYRMLATVLHTLRVQPDAPRG